MTDRVSPSSPETWGHGPSGTALRRRVVLLAALPFGLVGCATPTPVARDPEGSYCYRSKLERYIKGPCVSSGVPSLEVDRLAKPLPPHPALLTVYVVRESRADGQNLVKVVADQNMAFDMVPDSMARLRFKPGEHTLAFLFDRQRGVVQVEGQAGEVKVLRLRGTGWAWNLQYTWERTSPDAVQGVVQRTRLVADASVP